MKGDPITGELYEGERRKPGDVELSPSQANELNLLPGHERIRRLQEMSPSSAPAALSDHAKDNIRDWAKSRQAQIITPGITNTFEHYEFLKGFLETAVNEKAADAALLRAAEELGKYGKISVSATRYAEVAEAFMKGEISDSDLEPKTAANPPGSDEEKRVDNSEATAIAADAGATGSEAGASESTGTVERNESSSDAGGSANSAVDSGAAIRPATPAETGPSSVGNAGGNP